MWELTKRERKRGRFGQGLRGSGQGQVERRCEQRKSNFGFRLAIIRLQRIFSMGYTKRNFSGFLNEAKWNSSLQFLFTVEENIRQSIQLN